MQSSKPILAAKQRRQLYPFFFQMGPVALSISSVLLIGLMAIFYLTQQAQGVTINQQLQNTHVQESLLERQNQDVVNTIAQEQSPGYIEGQAKSLGLVSADPKAIHVVVTQHLTPIPSQDPHIQP